MVRLPFISSRGRRLPWRALGCLLGIAVLGACSSHAPRISAEQEAHTYQARARGGYQPPGPPDDPWGPYIAEAAAKFDVPDSWIRQVMRVESGGQQYRDGALITSNVGAMGLMQVMPGTYDDLRERYDLGDDPFDPHSNILAGVAYLREMYDIYGMPGFLAAYNAGPKRLDDYLANERPLPDETRRYVAMIAPVIAGDEPASRSPAEQYAMNALPDMIPAGLRYGRPAPLATVRYARATVRRPERAPVRMAERAEPQRAEPQRAEPRIPDRATLERMAAEHAKPERAPMRLAFAAPHRWTGFHLIAPAMADTLSHGRHEAPSGPWAAQAGTFAPRGKARPPLAGGKTRFVLAHETIASRHELRPAVYRTRTVEHAAEHACHKVHGRCVTKS